MTFIEIYIIMSGMNKVDGYSPFPTVQKLREHRYKVRDKFMHNRVSAAIITTFKSYLKRFMD